VGGGDYTCGAMVSAFLISESDEDLGGGENKARLSLLGDERVSLHIFSRK
jgi:hypothetical protein